VRSSEGVDWVVDKLVRSKCKEFRAYRLLGRSTRVELTNVRCVQMFLGASSHTLHIDGLPREIHRRLGLIFPVMSPLPVCGEYSQTSDHVFPHAAH
jgi:hypothetical protein